MTAFVKYDPNTGRIIQYGRVIDVPPLDYHAFKLSLATLGAPGVVIDAEVDDEVPSYVDPATQTVKPCAPCPIVRNGLVFTNIPVGTAVIVDGEAMGVVDDGTVEFSHDVPGLHQLVFTHPTYTRGIFEVIQP